MDGTKVGIKHLDIFICDWVIFHVFFSHFLIFFQNKLFRKILSGILSECQCFVRPDLGPNCKSYQQTSLGDKELKDMLIWTGTCIHLK